MPSASRPLWLEYLKNGLVGAVVGFAAGAATGPVVRALRVRSALPIPGLTLGEDLARLALFMAALTPLILASFLFYEAWIARRLRRAGRLPDASALRLCGFASLWSGGERVQGLLYMTSSELCFASARGGAGAYDKACRLADIDGVTPCRAGALRWRSLRVRSADGGELVVTPSAPRTWASVLGRVSERPGTPG